MNKNTKHDNALKFGSIQSYTLDIMFKYVI